MTEDNNKDKNEVSLRSSKGTKIESRILCTLFASGM